MNKKIRARLKSLENRLIETTGQMASREGREDKELWDQLVQSAEGIIEESFNLGRNTREQELMDMQRSIQMEEERSRQLIRLLGKAANRLKLGMATRSSRKLLGEIDANLRQQPKKLGGSK